MGWVGRRWRESIPIPFPIPIPFTKEFPLVDEWREFVLGWGPARCDYSSRSCDYFSSHWSRDTGKFQRNTTASSSHVHV